MARRVWEYNVLIACTTKLPVYSVVLYLVDDGIVIEPPYEERFCTGELIHHFRFRNIKLWEISASELRQPGLEGMLPLLPLTQNGARREVIDEVISDLARVKRQDLLPIAYTIAALVFPAHSENKMWLKERFRPMLNLFRKSWAYQDMVAEGKREGRQEVLQETCIRYVQKRFPSLADQAKQKINSLHDIDHLHQVFDALMDATTSAEVEHTLIHLSDKMPLTE